ncbi:phage tail sheath family protein [Maribius pontilimi]|uniref:Phage tail sheath family protein n=1 Tax=Palleronia pontilimi TaxID=1964209 RepID=A0A934IKW1_9RHOB|nr:phage tail sheath family protein [Palleronia pontilimi]MBJ3764435.1 phage tail sheath family protein [Palleronia pontilimi]
MPEYLRPGVYIQETSFRGKPIQGVSTSTAGFVGATRTGPEGKATFVSSYAHFKRLFGDPIAPVQNLGDYMGYAVKAFFENGGSRAYVVRALSGAAVASAVAIEQGTVLKLAPGVTVRGPTTSLRLNALRGVTVGTVLHVFTRPDANSPFAETRQLNVQGYDPQRDSITVAAGEIPAGVSLSPSNTVFLIGGMAPANANPLGGGASFTARHRGVDGDRISVEIRPRDRAPVALTSVSAVRQDPPLTLDAGQFPLAAGAVALQFDSASLRRLRVGDSIGVGTSSGLVIQAIADGAADLGVVGGGNGNDHSAGATVTLVSRGGAALPTPLQLADAAAGAGLGIDMSGANSFPGVALDHDTAMLLRPADVIRLDTGGVTTDLTVTAAQVAEEIAPGAHVTLAAPGLAAAEAGPVDPELEAASPGAAALPAAAQMSRLYLGDVSGFVAPNRAGALEAVAISDGGNIDTGHIRLVDPATSALWIATAAGEYPTNVAADDYATVEVLQVAADGDASVRVASTAAFYTGAKVELDTGTAKIERIVASIDGAARRVTFTAGLPLGAGNTIDLDPDPNNRRVYLRTCEIDVAILENGVVSEIFEGLTWNSDPATDAGMRYYVDRINDDEVGSALVRVAAAPAPGLGFAEAPVNANGQPKPLTGGDNGPALTELDLIGADNGPGQRTGIQALGERDDISMVAVPGVVAETVQGALITHCEKLLYRIAVLDAPLTALDVTALQSHRNNYDSKYAAYYAPWVRGLNPVNGRIESFPPSAYAMGIYARTDNTVGVHKAPANEVVRNITDVVLPFTGSEQDALNPVGINLIRDLAPRGIRMWGARTISSDQEWKYVNVRRLFIFLEHSIDKGTQWVVFEPNSEALWAKVVETITSFMTGVWKSGALMGTTPEEGFFVTCDRTTMTQDDIDNGRLVCEIGVAPVYPAEFVIFKIGQFTASSS